AGAAAGEVQAGAAAELAAEVVPDRQAGVQVDGDELVEARAGGGGQGHVEVDQLVGQARGDGDRAAARDRGAAEGDRVAAEGVVGPGEGGRLEGGGGEVGGGVGGGGPPPAAARPTA